jgi:membrane-associated phospholipid phosphatase
MTRSWVAWGLAGAFIALAIAVQLGLLDRLDLIARAWARPNDVWGAAQMRADLVVEGLRPIVVAGLLAAFTGAWCVKCRSLRPAAFVSAVCLAAVALTVAVKIIMGRPDPHGLLGSDGGSFPSGHVIVVTVGVGFAVLTARQGAGQWVLIIAAVAGGLRGLPATPGDAVVDRPGGREPARSRRDIRRDCLPLESSGATSPAK